MGLARDRAGRRWNQNLGLSIHGIRELLRENQTQGLDRDQAYAEAGSYLLGHRVNCTRNVVDHQRRLSA